MVSEKLLREFEQELVCRLPVPGHGAAVLPDVIVESYNIELRRQGQYVGDQAAKRVFFDRLDDWRAAMRKDGEDPLGDTPSESLSKKALDAILKHGDPVAAGIVQSAIEDFARALAQVIRFFHAKAWQRVSHIVIGGGFRGSRVGELAIGRAQVLLQEAGEGIRLLPIRHDPDEAGLVGSAYLLPRWMFAAYDAILAVDIGGTNVRCGIVRFHSKKDPTPSVEHLLLWRHSDDDPSREDVLQELISMLGKLINTAKRRKLNLAPFIGVGCPGRVRLDGRIEQGTGNLPGNWQAKRFHLPSLLQQGLPQINGQPSMVLLHNDAVVQGLSAIPELTDAKRWAVLTIGTGLGNAQFQNQPAQE